MSEDKTAEAPAAPSGPSKAPLLLALINTLAVLGAVGTLYYTKMIFKRPAITEETERKRLAEAHSQKTSAETTQPGIVAFEPVTVNIEAYPAPQATPSEDGAGAIKGKLHYVHMAFSIEIVDGGQIAAIDEVRPVIMDQILTVMSHKPFHELATVQGRYVLRTQIREMVNRLTEDLPSHPPLLASAAEKTATKSKAAEGHGEGGEGGEAKSEGGEGGEHKEAESAKKAVEPAGPPLKALYRDGLVTNVYFTQFIVQ